MSWVGVGPVAAGFLGACSPEAKSPFEAEPLAVWPTTARGPAQLRQVLPHDETASTRFRGCRQAMAYSVNFRARPSYGPSLGVVEIRAHLPRLLPGYFTLGIPRFLFVLASYVRQPKTRRNPHHQSSIAMAFLPLGGRSNFTRHERNAASHPPSQSKKPGPPWGI